MQTINVEIHTLNYLTLIPIFNLGVLLRILNPMGFKATCIFNLHQQTYFKIYFLNILWEQHKWLVGHEPNFIVIQQPM
jgi:hypothetical protein